jgi:hypothetical protein
MHRQDLRFVSPFTRFAPSGAHVTALHRGAALAIGLAAAELRRRFLDEDDPRRFHIAQVPLYGGTFIVIAAPCGCDNANCTVLPEPRHPPSEAIGFGEGRVKKDPA